MTTSWKTAKKLPSEVFPGSSPETSARSSIHWSPGVWPEYNPERIFVFLDQTFLLSHCGPTHPGVSAFSLGGRFPFSVDLILSLIAVSLCSYNDHDSFYSGRSDPHAPIQGRLQTAACRSQFVRWDPQIRCSSPSSADRQMHTCFLQDRIPQKEVRTKTWTTLGGSPCMDTKIEWRRSHST